MGDLSKGGYFEQAELKWIEDAASILYFSEGNL